MEKMLSKKAKDKEKNMGDKRMSESSVLSLSENLFQSKVLMWYLLKGLSSKSLPFQLGTEIPEAGKYDDLLLKYEKNVEGSKRDHFLIMQCKHRTEKNKVIRYGDILTDGNVDFGLVKCFNSFIESKNSKMFKDGEIEHAIIYTNARIDMKGKIPKKDQNWERLGSIENIVEEIKVGQDSVLSMCKIEGGKYYKFKSELILPVLKPMILDHEYYKIAQKLHKSLEDDKKYLSLEDKILKRHCCLLLTDVIDKESKTFREDFLKESFDDIVNSTGKQKLRRALEMVLKEKESTIDNYVKKKFKWRKDFEKHSETLESQPLNVADTDVEDFFERFVFAIEQPDEKKLDAVISSEIRTKYSQYDTDLIYDHFKKEIENWMKTGNFFIKRLKKLSKSKFISSKDAAEFFENTKQKFDEKVENNMMSGFKENPFQSNVLMWYLLKGLSSKFFPFQLGTEIPDVGKYRDLVLKYEKDIEGSKKDHFLIMQCKHSTGKNKVIRYGDILTDENVDFGLVKNIEWFAKLKKSKMFTNEKIEHAIIYTNARFDMKGKIPENDEDWGKLKNIGNIVEEMEVEQNSVLFLCKIEGGKYYKFKSELVLPVLKQMILDHEYYKIAQKLYKFLKDDKKYLSLEDKILERHCHFLLTDVIDKKSKSFRDDFIKERFENGVNSTGKQKLRRALDKVLKEKNSTIDKYINNKFKWRKNFETRAQSPQNQSMDVADADAKDFFEKCVFAIEQPDERKLDAIISSEIRIKYSKYDTDLIYRHFKREIVNWMNLGNFFIKKFELMSESKFISFKDAAEFFQKSIRKFDKMPLKGPIFDYDHYIKIYNIDFVDFQLDQVIETFSSSSRERILSIVTENTMITAIKLYMKLKKIIGSDDFVYVKLSSSNDSTQNLAIEAFEYESTNRWLVIEWDFVKTKLEEWTDKLDYVISTIQSHDEKKLIIISNRDDILKKYFQNQFSMDSECIQIKDIKNTLINLSEKSQDLFLNSTVKYQGSDATLRDFLFNKDLEKAVDGDILKKILKGEYVSIGMQIEGLKKDMKSCYIDRKFIFKVENEKNIYLISEMNEKDLCLENYDFKTIEKYETLTVNEINVFKREEEENKSINIYLLRKKCKDFVLLKKSKDPFEKTDFLNTINKPDKCEVNLITAIAGMGKSTLLSKLSRDIKDRNPEFWVVNFDLNAMSAKLNEIGKNERDINFETAVDFLHHGANHQNELEKRIFEYRLHVKNIVLCIDGFDKICPNYKFTVLKIISVLTNEAKINKIWLSTRPYFSILNDMKSSFTNCSLKHFDIYPFTKNNQKNCIKKIWKQSIEVNEIYFEKFIKELFKLFSNNIKDRKHEFLGIALHTMLFGVNFKDTFVKYQNTSTPETSSQLRDELLDILSLSSFYHQFVMYKCEIKCKDKDLSNIETITGNMVEKSYAECVNKNKLLALDTLFKKDALFKLLTETESKNLVEYKNEFNEKGDKIGIINQIANNKSQFIHQTFAEFFVAMFFVDNLKKEGKESQKVVEYFLKYVISEENTVICGFIDSMLYDETLVCNNTYNEVITKMSGEKLHFVLKKNWRNISEILILNGIALNFEKNGVTVFHSASEMKNLKGKKPILSLIFEKTKYDDNALENIFRGKCYQDDKSNDNYEKSPLFNAIETNRIENVKTLLEKCRKMKILNNVILCENEHGENILHHATKNYILINLLDELKSQPEKLIKLLFKKDKWNYTPFDYTIRKGNLEIFETVLNLLEDLNISKGDFLWNENENGENILHHVTKSDSIDILIYFLNVLKNQPNKLKILLSKKDKGNNTPFDNTVKSGNFKIFKSMLNLLEELNMLKEDDFWNENENGESILHHAIKRGDNIILINLLDVLKSHPNKLANLLLKKDKENNTPFDNTVKSGNSKMFKTILKFFKMLNIFKDNDFWNENKNGENILHHATKSDGNETLINLLDVLKHQPDKLKILLLKRDHESNTPFDKTIKCGNLKIFKTMLNLLEELNILNDNDFWNENINGKNILHHAVKSDGNDILSDLLDVLKNQPDKLKILPLKKDHKSHTPLDVAAKEGKPKKNEILMSLQDLWNENKSDENVAEYCRGEEMENKDYETQTSVTRKDSQNYYRESSLLVGHEDTYGSKFLMLYLLKEPSKCPQFHLAMKLRLASEFEMIFKYKKTDDGTGQDCFTIMHKIEKNGKITYKDIIEDKDQKFNLGKYIEAFVKAKTEKTFKNGVIENIIIHTNASFDFFKKIPMRKMPWKNLKNITENVKTETEDILSLCAFGKCYRFQTRFIISKFSVYYQIAQKLVESLIDGKYLTPEGNIFKKVDCLLMKEAIDKKTKTFRSDFLDESDKNATEGSRQLRRALDDVLKEKNININEIAAKEFSMRNKFGNGKEQHWPDENYVDIEEFSRKCIFATHQPDEEELKNIIMSEIVNKNIHTDFTYEDLSNKIQEVIKNKTGEYVSSEDIRCFYKTTISKKTAKFIDPDMNDEIWNFRKSEKKFLNIISEHVIISSIKMTESLKENNVEFKSVQLQNNNNDDVLGLVKTFESSDSCTLLVISSLWSINDANINLQQFIDLISEEIIEMTRNDDRKQIIVISGSEDILKDNLRSVFEMTDEYAETKDTKITFSDLTKDSQYGFLDTKMRFQGFELKFNDLFDISDMKKLIDNDLLSEILENSGFVDVGKQNEPMQNYISRKFTRIVENDNNLYLLSNLTETDILSGNEKFEVIDKSKENSLTENECNMCDRIVEKHSSKNIYILRKENGKFNLLKKPKDSDSDSEITTSLQKEGKLNIVCEPTGAGKSTLFANWSSKMKNENDVSLIINIDLSSVSLSELKNIKDVQLETIIKYSQYGLCHKSELERRIFEHLLSKKEIVLHLHLEAFDEICSDDKSNIEFIQKLNKLTMIKKIWINTSANDSKLKKLFAEIPYKHFNIEPLTKEEQRMNK